MNLLLVWILSFFSSVGMLFLLQSIVGKDQFDNPFWDRSYYTKGIRIYQCIFSLFLCFVFGPVGTCLCILMFLTNLWEYYDKKEEEFKKNLNK